MLWWLFSFVRENALWPMRQHFLDWQSHPLLSKCICYGCIECRSFWGTVTWHERQDKKEVGQKWCLAWLSHSWSSPLALPNLAKMQKSGLWNVDVFADVQKKWTPEQTQMWKKWICKRGLHFSFPPAELTSENFWVSEHGTSKLLPNGGNFDFVSKKKNSSFFTRLDKWRILTWQESHHACIMIRMLGCAVCRHMCVVGIKRRGKLGMIHAHGTKRLLQRISLLKKLEKISINIYAWWACIPRNSCKPNRLTSNSNEYFSPILGYFVCQVWMWKNISIRRGLPRNLSNACWFICVPNWKLLTSHILGVAFLMRFLSIAQIILLRRALKHEP